MITFHSRLAPWIRSLLRVKHAMGLPYDSSAQHLKAFDAMCAQDFADQDTLTRQMADRWILGRPDEHPNGLLRRITPIRQLAKHMAGLGLEAYVIPPGIPARQIRYRPHVFSHQQLRALFDAADAIDQTPYSGQRHVIIPVVFRMIYCLGLRPGEARKLHRADVCFQHGQVTIRESKGHKDRIVYMSPDLLEYCRDYDTVISSYYPNRVPFFPNHSGNFYGTSTIGYWFNELLEAANPAIVAAPGSPPRTYDLRHSHVVEVINRWTRAGEDPQALVTYLSVHLGHTNTHDTWYYFHLVADFYPDLRKLANTSLEALFPEAHHEYQ